MSKHNMTVLAASLFMLSSGMSIVAPILPIFIQQLGHYDPGQAARWSGIIQGSTFAVSALMAPVWGMLGDRFGRKLMMLRAFFGMSLTMSLVSLARSPLQLLLIRIVHGSLGGAISTAIAFASAHAQEKKMARTLAFLHTAMMAGSVLGPLMGGVLADAFGFRICFVLTGIILLCCGFLIAFFVHEDRSSLQKKESFSVHENFRYLLASRQLVLIAAVMFLVQMIGMGMGPILPLFIASLYPSKAMLSTIIGSVFGITGLASALSVNIWGHRADRSGYKQTVLIAMTGTTLCFCLLPFSQVLWQVYALRIFTGAFVSGVTPVMQSLAALNTPANRRGGMYGTITTANLLGNATGPILAGFIAKAFGFRISIGFLALLFVTASLTAWIGIRERKHTASEADQMPDAKPIKAEA